MFLFWCRGPAAASRILFPSEEAYQKKKFSSDQKTQMGIQQNSQLK